MPLRCQFGFVKILSHFKASHVGAAYLFLGMAVFGSATPVSKIVGADLPIFVASFFRVILGSLFLFPFVVKNLPTKAKKIKAKDWYYILLISIFGMVGFTVFLIWGMKFVTGVVGSLIMSVTPALTGLASYFFLKSPLGLKRMIALMLGVFGVIVANVFGKEFGFNQDFQSYMGVSLVFLAICCEAVYTLVGKKVTNSVSPLLVTFLASTLSIPMFFLLASFSFSEVQWNQIGLNAWFSLSWWGVGTLGLGSVLWYTGLSKAEGSTAAGFMSVMPISALLLSYTLLNETFYFVHLIGIGLVLSSVVLMSWVHAHE